MASNEVPAAQSPQTEAENHPSKRRRVGGPTVESNLKSLKVTAYEKVVDSLNVDLLRQWIKDVGKEHEEVMRSLFDFKGQLICGKHIKRYHRDDGYGYDSDEDEYEISDWTNHEKPEGITRAVALKDNRTLARMHRGWIGSPCPNFGLDPISVGDDELVNRWVLCENDPSGWSCGGSFDLYRNDENVDCYTTEEYCSNHKSAMNVVIPPHPESFDKKGKPIATDGDAWIMGKHITRHHEDTESVESDWTDTYREKKHTDSGWQDYEFFKPLVIDDREMVPRIADCEECGKKFDLAKNKTKECKSKHLGEWRYERGGYARWTCCRKELIEDRGCRGSNHRAPANVIEWQRLLPEGEGIMNIRSFRNSKRRKEILKTVMTDDFETNMAVGGE